MHADSRRWLLRILSACVCVHLRLICFAENPLLESQILFPTEHWHNHASCIVELPNGDFFATWYHGSGERTADDVIIEGARLSRGQSNWSPRFTLADTPNFPDANPARANARCARVGGLKVPGKIPRKRGWFEGRRTNSITLYDKRSTDGHR